MAKKKQSKQTQMILFITGIIFIFGGICLLTSGINTYINQTKQKDWLITTATVINVDKYQSRDYKTTKTRYDILYQYETKGNIYTGEINKTNIQKKLVTLLKLNITLIH